MSSSHLLYDVLSGAVARGLDHSVRLLRGNFMDLDKEHIVLCSSSSSCPSSSSFSTSHSHLLLSLQHRVLVI